MKLDTDLKTVYISLQGCSEIPGPNTRQQVFRDPQIRPDRSLRFVHPLARMRTGALQAGRSLLFGEFLAYPLGAGPEARSILRQLS